MSAITVEPVAFENGNFECGKYVQQMFDWDAPVAQSQCAVSLKDPSVEVVAQRSPQGAVSPNQVRRGRCEHVGSVMATVLSKYGLGIDDLLRAIEERQSQVAVSR